MITPPLVRRNTPQRYRMEAYQCTKCGKIFFPGRLVCDRCKHREFEMVTLPEEGKVITHTVIRTPPTGFSDLSPYCVGIVEMANGVRILCQIADCEPETLAVGLPVTLEFRRVQEDGESGVLAYGYKAVPAR